ncbi:MAG TPA: tetratricopeptide repeat protein [Ktedonobacteraceae bacterium]
MSLHRLVQEVQLDRMQSLEHRQWARRVVCAVNALFPDDPKEGVDAWPQCLRYLEQAQACAALIRQYHLHLPEAARLLDRVGIYLREHASYSIAEDLFERAISIAAQHESEQLQVAFSLYNLGDLYREQGKCESAEPLLLQALSIREQTPGPDHPQLAFPLTSLGILYKQLGKYELAEPLYRRTLHIREQAPGPDHPQLAYPLNSLGNLYREQGKFEQAERLYQRSFHIRAQALGSEHPLVAVPLTNLGDLYSEQDNDKLAESLLQQALQLNRRWVQSILIWPIPSTAWPTSIEDRAAIPRQKNSTGTRSCFASSL